MSEPVILWIRGRSPPWPGLVEGLGPGAVVEASVDPTSMREVRAAAVEARPAAIVYAGPRDPHAVEPEQLFRMVAEATIGVAAAAMELSATAVLISHPAVFSGRGGPWSEGDPTRPADALGEAFDKAETFLARAAGDRALVVRAGPVLGRGLDHERARLRAGVAPARGRRLTPVADLDLGRAIRTLVEAGARGTVHVGGPAVDEAELWAQISRAVGIPTWTSDAVTSGDRGSWALESARLANWGLSAPTSWAEGLAAAAAEADPGSSGGGDGSTEPGPASLALDRLWSRAPPRGSTEVGSGLWLWMLAPGETVEVPAAARAVVVRAGKAVVEVGEDVDYVVRAGQRLRGLDEGAGSSRVMAIEASEVWIFGGDGA